MKKILRFLTISIMIMMVAGLSTTVFASSTTRKAKNAYVKAINNRTIKTSKEMWCALKDVDKNGVPDLLISKYGRFYIYTYRNGKVVRMVKRDCEYYMYYNAKKRIFSEVGEGGSGWRIDYKLKNGKLVETARYEGYSKDGKFYQYKIVGSKKTPISRKRYLRVFNGAEENSCLVKMTKSQLKKKLKK